MNNLLIFFTNSKMIINNFLILLRRVIFFDIFSANTKEKNKITRKITQQNT